MKKLDQWPYKVSRDGKVFNLNGRERKLVRTRDGYLKVNLYNKGKFKTYLVHRLVAELYIPNPDKKPQVNHLNKDVADNRVENLEWCTMSENHRHAFDNGRVAGNRKLTDEQADLIRKDSRGLVRLARVYNVSESTIARIRRKEYYI